ncbi:hypothetical protein TNCV_2550881 [Trichonephila clavipes]|nr:hypothetical protein TNCV_2550881 [Trichonephila clavipes]
MVIVCFLSEFFYDAAFRSRLSGRDSLVVKITDLRLACHEFEPIAAEHPPCKMIPIHVKSEEAQTSFRCGLEGVRRGCGRSGVILVTCPGFEITRSFAKCSLVNE